MSDNVENTIQKLDTEVDRANAKFEYFYDLDKKRIIWMIVGLIILPVVTGCFAAKMFMSDPVLRFNKTTCDIYRDKCGYCNYTKH